MFCPRCERPLSDKNASRRKTDLCQRCAVARSGRKGWLHKIRSGMQQAKRRAGVRKIMTILKGLP